MVRKPKKATKKKSDDVLSIFKKKEVVKHYEDIPRQRNLEIMRERGESLDNIRIDGKTIRNMDFRTTKFIGVAFEDSVFENCIFQGSNFLESDKLVDVTFSNCDMRWATLTEAQLEQNEFVDCNMGEINKVV